MRRIVSATLSETSVCSKMKSCDASICNIVWVGFPPHCCRGYIATLSKEISQYTELCNNRYLASGTQVGEFQTSKLGGTHVNFTTCPLSSCAVRLRTGLIEGTPGHGHGHFDSVAPGPESYTTTPRAFLPASLDCPSTSFDLSMMTT